MVDGSGTTRRRHCDNIALHRLAFLASGDPTVVRGVATERDAARSGLNCRKQQRIGLPLLFLAIVSRGIDQIDNDGTIRCRKGQNTKLTLAVFGTTQESYC